MKGISIAARLKRWQADRQTRDQIAKVEAYFQSQEGDRPVDGRPVLFFNASTRIGSLSLNAAFSLLASWSLRGTGIPTRNMVCRWGMLQCMLGTNPDNLEVSPPCKTCTRYSDHLFPQASVMNLTQDNGAVVSARQSLEGKSLAEMAEWQSQGFEMGQLCLPTLQWALRRYHLHNDETTRTLFRQYLISASVLERGFKDLYKRHQPRAIVLFNGITYPEAIARAVAQRQGIPVVTHEVGLRPYSAFFTHGQATFREVQIPPNYELGPVEDKRLDDYLDLRSQGRFTMAGVRFWPEMQTLDDRLLVRIKAHRQMVVVFPNVIFDTSQVHANTIYTDMFAWLGDVRQMIELHEETLFIIRAHPDEDRPGKKSRESVSDWVRHHGLDEHSNVEFFSPKEHVSSYELIRRAKITLIYNSSIGLEATISGYPVLCAGRARFTQIPTVYFPDSRESYLAELESFLDGEVIPLPEEFIENARRFLYYELYHASLDFSRFLEPYPGLPGFVTFSRFDPRVALSEGIPEVKAIREGIIKGDAFVYPS